MLYKSLLSTSTARFRLEMLSDGVSEHHILKIFLGEHAPKPPRWTAYVVFAASASVPPQAGKCSYTYDIHCRIYFAKCAGSQ